MSSESRDDCVQRPKFFTHANRANPAIGLEQSNFVRFAGFARVYNNPINTVSKAFYPVALRQSAKK